MSWSLDICQKFAIVSIHPLSIGPAFSFAYSALSGKQGDAIAGLTVAMTVIPQGLAYAGVAGLPPQYGLYSAFMGCFVYVFLGTAKDITFGPTAIMSLMVGEFGKGKIESKRVRER